MEAKGEKGKPKVKMVFEGKKEDIKDQLALSIMSETRVHVTSIVREAFEGATATDTNGS